MTRFYEDAKSPIVAELLRQDFDFEEPEVLRLIDRDEEAHNLDSTIALASGAACIAAAAGTLALSGFTLPILLPALGIGACGVSFWCSKVSARDRETEAEFLTSHPEVLDKVQGKLRAGERRDAIAAAFEQCLRAYRWGDAQQMARALGSGESSQIPQTIADAVVQHQNNSPTGLMHPASVQTELQPSGAAAPSVQHIVSPVWNPAQDLGENPQSALIVGTPGSGKGMIISNAIRALKEREPALKVFVIDPKADPKERGYWDGISDTYRCYSLLDGDDPDEGAMWLLACMAEFRSIDGPKLCIFDELMSAAVELELADSKLKALSKLKKFVVNLVGQGDSRSVWLWAMTQSPQVKDLGISGGARANLRVIGLVSPKNMTAVEALVSTQLIPKPSGGMDELRQIMSNSPVNRAVFDGKIARWLPMPELPNHSGFDRDSRKSSPAPETRSPAPSIEEKKAEIQRMKIEIERLREGNRERMDERISAGIDYEMHDSFDPPRDRLERLWDASPDAIEVEAAAIVERPDGLDDYPLVATVWDYLDGKDPRSLKQISGAMKTGGKISEDDLKSKVGNFETYKDAIKTVLIFGVKQGFLRQVSEDAYETIRKQ